MTWESPNLSKGDIEKLTIILDDYIFYCEKDGDGYIADAKRLSGRLNDHLDKYE